MPPPSVLGRAVTWQGLCCTIAGLFGTANGTTAYNENIGAMQVRLLTAQQHNTPMSWHSGATDMLYVCDTACACSAQITGVGSRRVIQVASVLIMVVAVIGETAGFVAVIHVSSLSSLNRLLTACCPRTRRQVWRAVCLDAPGDGQRPVRSHVWHHRREALLPLPCPGRLVLQ